MKAFVVLLAVVAAAAASGLPSNWGEDQPIYCETDALCKLVVDKASYCKNYDPHKPPYTCQQVPNPHHVNSVDYDDFGFLAKIGLLALYPNPAHGNKGCKTGEHGDIQCRIWVSESSYCMSYAPHTPPYKCHGQ